ncbi:MAG: hypothetical protein JSU66_11160 [Deltaproteobacteria bacterium]|nr:MAG: hypothetical protein JSU66_11160 [Deltaproteobacteria bacterium]
MVRVAPALAVAALLGCVPLPVRLAPDARGVVVDAVSGAPLGRSLVLIRFEARYDEVLPDRLALGQREAVSGRDGRFEAPGLVQVGFQAWPWLRAQARVVTVLRRGYRCPRPRELGRGAAARIALQPAESLLDQRAACQEVPELWELARTSAEVRRALARMGLEGPPSADLGGDDERTLTARAALGFGANCQGPIRDLALAPDGARVAFLAGGPSRADVFVNRLEPEIAAPELVARSVPTEGRELLWTHAAELALRGSDRLDGPGFIDVVWAPNPAPAARSPGAGTRLDLPALVDPDDRNDEGDARWLGRSFSMTRDLEPATGLPRDLLHVTRPDGSSSTLPLPGETCAVRGRFGRPHYRITADGRFGLDLRFVEGGCHVVRIDLDSGAWARLDAVTGAAACREERRIPPSQLGFALRDYVRDVEQRLASAAVDPTSAYTLVIVPGAAASIETRTRAGERRSLPARPFPIVTPLHRIHVSLVGRTP